MSPQLPRFSDLIAAVDRRAERIPVAIAGAADVSVLYAVQAAWARDWIEPILIGFPDDILAAADAIDLRSQVNSWQIVPANPDDLGTVAVAVVTAGRAKLLMKGQVATPQLVSAMLRPEAGLRTEHVINQTVLMELPRDDRRLLLCDTGVSVSPDVEKLADLLRGVIQTAQQLGVPRPKVALMAATEKVNNAMPETLIQEELVQRSRRGEFGECDVSGPLSFDLAYDREAGTRKGVRDPVIGAADVLLFPNLLSANLTVKAIMYTAECKFGGVLRGARCPVVFMSRADDSDTRLRSLALALQFV